MYNTNKWVGKSHGALILLTEPYSSNRKDKKVWKLDCYCKICGCTTTIEKTQILRRSKVACSQRCTKIHLADMPIDFWEDNEIDVEYLVTHLMVVAKSKKLHATKVDKHHIKLLSDLYTEQDNKCALLGTRLYRGKSSEDRYRTASIDRVDNLIGYDVIENNRWIHKGLNEMLNCMTDERLFQFSKLLVDREEIISQKI